MPTTRISRLKFRSGRTNGADLEIDKRKVETWTGTNRDRVCNDLLKEDVRELPVRIPQVRQGSLCGTVMETLQMVVVIRKVSVARQHHLRQLIRTPKAFHGSLSMKGFAPEPTQRAVEVPKLGHGNESGDRWMISHPGIISHSGDYCGSHLIGDPEHSVSSAMLLADLLLWKRHERGMAKKQRSDADRRVRQCERLGRLLRLLH